MNGRAQNAESNTSAMSLSLDADDRGLRSLLPKFAFAQDPSQSSLALAALIAEGDGPIEADKQPQLPEAVPASPDASQDFVWLSS